MKARLRTAVGIALSLLLLAWALRDVSAAEVAREIRDADPVLFAVSIAITLLGFGFRAVRWGILLLPMGLTPPLRPRFAATVVGFAANNLLPARIGEFARAFSLSRLSRVPLAAAIATLVVERLFDAVALMGLLFASMAVASFPASGSLGGVDPRSAARVVALLMGGMGIVLGLLVAVPARALAAAERVAGWVLPRSFRAPVLGALGSFIEGLAVLRNGRLFAASLVLAVGQWLFTALSFLLGFLAFGIREVPFAGAVFLQSLIALAVAVPSSPGFFGPFEAAAKVGLSLWGVSAEKAVSFAVGYHLGGFLPVTAMGIYYVWRLKLSWREVRHSDEIAEEAAGAAARRSAPPSGLLRDEG